MDGEVSASNACRITVLVALVFVVVEIVVAVAVISKHLTVRIMVPFISIIIWWSSSFGLLPVTGFIFFRGHGRRFDHQDSCYEGCHSG